MMTYAPTFRIGHPVLPAVRPQQRHQLGNLASLDVVDWGLLVGGAIVGGAGINGLVRQFTAPGHANAIPVLLDLVIAGVGLTVFLQKGRQAFSA
jgi:hypothetical protein